MREIERQFRQLAEQTEHVFWLVTVDLKSVQYISPTYERVWGRSIESLYENPSSFLEGIHPEDRAEVAQRTRERLETRDTAVKTFEYRLLRPDGEVRWVRATSFALINSEGVASHLAGLAEDITMERRGGEALRQSEERFRTILENAPVMIDSFDADGRCLLWNQECERQLGWTQDDISRHADPLSLTYPDPDEKRRVAGIIAQADGQFREYDVRAKSGEVRTQLWADFRLPDGATISVGHDITDRKVSEDALRESEMRHRLLFENAGSPVTFLDRHGVFVLMNEVAAENLGGTPEQFIGKSVHDLFPPDAAKEYAARMERVYSTGEGAGYEDEVMLPTGVTRWYWSTLHPVRSAEGQITGVQLVSHDITDRKLAEQVRKESEEQLRALATQLQTIREEEGTKISREIHDELGQVLTALKMDLAWVQRRVERANSRDTRAAVVEKIASMYDEIDETIESVRRISTRLRPGLLDDLGLMGALEWEAEQFKRRTGVRCDMTVPQSTDADLDERCATAVFRIFQEILTNVARHAEASSVTISVLYDAGSVSLSVADDGKGMGDSDERSPGLGIIGMRERAAHCGGSIKIESSNGNGTRVDVSIPFAFPEAGA